MLAAKRPLMSAERLKMLAAKLPQRCSERSWHKGTTAERVSRLLRAGGHVSSETLLVGCLAQDLKGYPLKAVGGSLYGRTVSAIAKKLVQVVSTKQVLSTKAKCDATRVV